MDKTYNDLPGFDKARLERLMHYNRKIQEHANASDDAMAKCFFVTEKTYVKNIKYQPPAASAIKYARLHYEYGVCLDRYLADDTRFELFVEENAAPRVFIPNDCLETELQRLLKEIDDAVTEEEKFWIAAKNAQMFLRWLTFGDMLRCKCN
ncbi:MAG: hypothetical protein J6N21_14400 [Butyrivibrio sp.]|nr:hypothetical protein [Butyrivibrio sp.]MBR4342096.1 hypothetical protein [Lachnospiraceae bacterium]